MTTSVIESKRYLYIMNVQTPILSKLITGNLGNLTRVFADDTSLSYSGRNYDIMKSDINNELSKLNTRLKLATHF